MGEKRICQCRPRIGKPVKHYHLSGHQPIGDVGFGEPIAGTGESR